MGQVYPRVGLDCRVGTRFFPLLMNRVGVALIAKSVLKYITITSIAYMHCLLRFFGGSGFVGSRTRGLHGLDWVCLILGWVKLDGKV